MARRIVAGAGVVLGVYLILRAVVELLVIDYGDPAGYRDDWGGPSLAGVLAVHCLPGIAAAVLLVRAVRRRRTRNSVGTH